MVLLRRVIGDALRARRQSQHRTLREVSTAANVSLGYLSEIERGQKEASSELLSAICDALGAQQSEVLREASDTLALAEQMERMLVPVVDRSLHTDGDGVIGSDQGNPVVVDSVASLDAVATLDGVASIEGMSVVDGDVAVAVHRSGPLKTTLRATRTQGGRSVVRAA